MKKISTTQKVKKDSSNLRTSFFLTSKPTFYSLNACEILYGNAELQTIPDPELKLNSKDAYEDGITLLNIIAFLVGEPIFHFFGNPEVNNKMEELYKKFSILESITISEVNYFKKYDYEITRQTVFPNLLCDNISTNSVVFSKMNDKNAVLLSLYHDSLRQFDPFSRCVFLVRVCEYTAHNLVRNESYAKNSHNGKPCVWKVIDYFFEKALKSKTMTPIYYYEEINEKIEMKNLITTLKNKSRKIKKRLESSAIKSKSNDTVGKMIYRDGRCSVAHAASDFKIIDYSNDYFLVNDMNIILELIVRFIVEDFNPEIKNKRLKLNDKKLKDIKFNFANQPIIE